MKTQLLLISALFSISNITYVSAATGPSSERWQQFNQAAISQHIEPKYQALSQQTRQLTNDISRYCDGRQPSQLLAAQLQFKKSLQAWQQVQHIQFGPVTLLMRNFSLQYWPDKKNLGGKQLRKLLNDQSIGDFDDEFFARASVAVKGFPAMEKMLFEQPLLDIAKENKNYCEMLQSISSFVASNTQSIVKEWQEEKQNYQSYSEDAVYESAAEGATEILKALVEPLEAISDIKLKAPLGKSVEKLRWRKSESWRSQQSVENIRSNIKALHHLYSGAGDTTVRVLLAESGSEALATSIEAQFAELEALLTTLSEPVDMKYSKEAFNQLVVAQQKLKRLSDALIAAMKPLQIQLGFNRRDGD